MRGTRMTRIRRFAGRRGRRRRRRSAEERSRSRARDCVRRERRLAASRGERAKCREFARSCRPSRGAQEPAWARLPGTTGVTSRVRQRRTDTLEHTQTHGKPRKADRKGTPRLGVRGTYKWRSRRPVLTCAKPVPHPLMQGCKRALASLRMLAADRTATALGGSLSGSAQRPVS